MPGPFATWRWQQSACGALVWVAFATGMWWARMPMLWRPFLPPCLFRQFLGWPCPTCGATRATLALAQGRWLAALQWNPLIILAYAAILIGAVTMISFAVMNRRLRSAQIDAVLTNSRWWLVGAVAANWIYLLLRP